MEYTGGLTGENHQEPPRVGITVGGGELYSGLCTRQDVVDDNWVVFLSCFHYFLFMLLLWGSTKRARVARGAEEIEMHFY